MSIFSKNCLDYLKKGFSVLPDSGKKPIVKNWTKYSNQQPTQEEIKQWCGEYSKANISIMCGKKAGIIAIDFDEIDPEIIKLIEHLLPESPVERIGKKGWVRFFQYSGESTKDLFRTVNGKKSVVVELLSDKKKVTIPPSIHPDTNKEYKWTGKSLLDVDVSDLPKLPPFLFDRLQEKLKIFNTTDYSDKPKVVEGRNLELSTFTGKLIQKPHTLLGAVNDLVSFDKNNNKKPLFSDPNETKFNDPNFNALIFYMNHLTSINHKRSDNNEKLELPIMSSEVNVIDTLLNQDKNKTKLPEPTGLLKLIYDHILAHSYIEQPVFALSAALALVGTLASRKFVFQNTTPNFYILNIADSGSGKDSCQQIIKDLLFKINAGGRLLGATSYPSEAAIIKNLDVNPVRLDIIDECSTFLSAASKGGASYAVGIGDTLCELFSCSNSYYLGKALASMNVNIGQVQRPHINLLCSTTYRGLHESISITSLEKGLFARFLVFFGANNNKGKRVLGTKQPPKELLEMLEWLYKFTPPIKNKGNFTEFNCPAYKLPLTRQANELLTIYHQRFDKMRVESKSSGYRRPIIARLYQHMLKIVLVSAISNTKDLNTLPIVKPGDVEFAYQLINYYLDNIVDFVKDNLYASQREMKLNKVLNAIKNAKEDGLTNIQLARQCTFLPTNERIDIIKDLKESNRIVIEPIENPEEGQYKFYYLG
jgi:hypothetical protein